MQHSDHGDPLKSLLWSNLEKGAEWGSILMWEMFHKNPSITLVVFETGGFYPG
jgi:hypothetical protein